MKNRRIYGMFLCLCAIVAGDIRAAPAHYRCTLKNALSGNKAVVLMFEVESGRVAKHALMIGSRADTVQRMPEHRLKVEDGRLKGPIEVWTGFVHEKFDLNVPLGGPGTYRAHYGCPEGTRKVDGKATVEFPKDPQAKRHVIWLRGAMGPKTTLGLVLNLDREARTVEGLHGWARGYNLGHHVLDVTRLAFDGTVLDGEIGIRVVDAPKHKLPIEGMIKMKIVLRAGDDAGEYSAVFGIDKTRPGDAVVERVSATETQAVLSLLAPPIDPRTPWRGCLVVGPHVRREDGKLKAVIRWGDERMLDPAAVKPEETGFSGMPEPDWMKPEADVSCWPRYQSGELEEYLGGYGAVIRGLWPALLCLRTRFGVADPAVADDLTVTVECIGGAVVYVNGREIGRGFMPEGKVHPLTPALDYPIEAYTMKDGETPLPSIKRGAAGKRPEAERQIADRCEKRIRRFTVAIPRGGLVKGGNVLAIEIHGAAICGGGAWSHLGFHAARLTSRSGAGVISYGDAIRRTRIWSADQFDQVTARPKVRSLVHPHGSRGRSAALKGTQFGNPFDPIRPVRMLVPRNGVCSGQVVVSNPDGLKRVAGIIHDLKGPGGAIIPVRAVQVRYAAQHDLVHYCDGLMKKPPEGAVTVPIWLIVQAPRDAVPGWYGSTLEITADGNKFTVPVQLLVSPVTVPDSRDFTSQISIAESPESVALHYGVKCWSDEHLKYWEKSLELMGQVGNDVLHVPVILGSCASYATSWAPKSSVNRPGPGRRVPLIRWVRKDGKLVPEFSLLEKALDVYSKYCAPPQALSLYVWDVGCAKKLGDAYENRRIPTRANWTPPSRMLVSVWDPATDSTTDTEVPTIDDSGGEEFWKPLFEGVREIVKRRGWSERIIMASLGGDMRPAHETAALVREWVPYLRWNFLSHFSGDPAPKDGKLIATGGCEIGLKEYPAGGWLSMAQLEKSIQEPLHFLELPTYRGARETMPPIAFRTWPIQWGRMSRVALDFWPGHGGPGSASWFSHSNRLVPPGPNGAVLSVRFQMLREGAQEHEIRAAMIRAYTKLPPARQEPYRALLAEAGRRAMMSAEYLPAMEHVYDWPAYVARVHAAAAELAGLKMDTNWEEPPR